MSLPSRCSWLKSCLTHDCTKNGDCLTSHVSNGPNGVSHTINNEYLVEVCGISIPLVDTKRSFSFTKRTDFWVPKRDSIYYAAGALLVCEENTGDVWSTRFLEDCTITKSTLHYVDERYNVVLYRKQTDSIKIDKVSSEVALIKESWGIFSYGQVQIKTNDYKAKSVEEWHLCVEGKDIVIAYNEKELHPFGPKNNGQPSGTGLFPEYAPDPETRLVVITPNPPSMGIPWSDVLVRLGCYEFGYDTAEGAESTQNKLDGGNKDHFYPEWCRVLQPDPFWTTAAQRRYNISWFHSDTQTEPIKYYPPALSVSPLPIGTFVKHPQVGSIYQWLLTTLNNERKLVSSQDFNNLINGNLLSGLATSDMTLYYPIGVI